MSLAAFASSAENISCGPRPGVHGIDAHAAQFVRHRRRQPPRARPRRRSSPRTARWRRATPAGTTDDPVELPDELLPDHPGRAENADVDSLRLHDAPPIESKKNPPPCWRADGCCESCCGCCYVTRSHTAGGRIRFARFRQLSRVMMARHDCREIIVGSARARQTVFAWICSRPRRRGYPCRLGGALSQARRRAGERWRRRL